MNIINITPCSVATQLVNEQLQIYVLLTYSASIPPPHPTPVLKKV
jgi:hypothetical protein